MNKIKSYIFSCNASLSTSSIVRRGVSLHKNQSSGRLSSYPHRRLPGSVHTVSVGDKTHGQVLDQCWRQNTWAGA